MPRYLKPSSCAATAISSSVLAPSLQVVWLWNTPLEVAGLDQLRQLVLSAASISPVFSRSSGGT